MYLELCLVNERLSSNIQTDVGLQDLVPYFCRQLYQLQIQSISFYCYFYINVADSFMLKRSRILETLDYWWL